MVNKKASLTERIAARCSTKEKEDIKVAAEASNRKFSDYVRLVMLEAVQEEKKV